MPPKTYRKADVFFICQFSEARLRVVKCAHTIARRVEFVEVKTEEFLTLADKETLSVNLGRILKELDYKYNLLIVSLPRAQATCRYLKIPSKIPVEIEQIASISIREVKLPTYRQCVVERLSDLRIFIGIQITID